MTLDSFREATRMAFDTVRANKLRSGLTILGVMVGVLTVVFMVSIIQGLSKTFAQQIESLGSNTIFVSKFDPSFGRPPGMEERMRKDVTLEDAAALGHDAPSVAGVAPIERKISVTIRYGNTQSETPILLGVTPDYEFVLSQYLGRGRFISDVDLQERANVVVLGVDVVHSLFPNEDPIGKELKIGGNPFRVIGVMESLGNFFGQSRDNSLFIPIGTFLKYYRDFPFPDVVFFIIIRPKTRAQVHSAIDEIRDILRRRRQVGPQDKDNFGISSQDSLLDIYNQLTGATFLVLTAVSFVALMIGGIGVMNIMLVSVTERTKEIGLRKAVGATRKIILAQFLTEAVLLTSIGGLIGLIVGEVASLLMNKFSPLPAYVPIWTMFLAIGISAMVGIVFGMWPAWKAARMNPIDALRWE